MAGISFEPEVDAGALLAVINPGYDAFTAIKEMIRQAHFFSGLRQLHGADPPVLLQKAEGECPVRPFHLITLIHDFQWIVNQCLRC